MLFRQIGAKDTTTSISAAPAKISGWQINGFLSIWNCRCQTNPSSTNLCWNRSISVPIWKSTGHRSATSPAAANPDRRQGSATTDGYSTPICSVLNMAFRLVFIRPEPSSAREQRSTKSKENISMSKRIKPIWTSTGHRSLHGITLKNQKIKESAEAIAATDFLFIVINRSIPISFSSCLYSSCQTSHGNLDNLPANLHLWFSYCLEDVVISTGLTSGTHLDLQDTSPLFQWLLHRQSQTLYCPQYSRQH